ncbi:unnamed protein product, partial [Laminaria digitata]
KRGRSFLGDANDSNVGDDDDDDGDGEQQPDHRRLQQETREAAKAGEKYEGGDAIKKCRSEHRQDRDSHDNNSANGNGIRKTPHLAHTTGPEEGGQVENAEGGKERDRPIDDSTAAAMMTPNRDGKASSSSTTTTAEVLTSRTSSAPSAQGSGGSPIDALTQRHCIVTGVENDGNRASNRGSGADGGEVYSSSSSSSSSSSRQGLLLEDIELVNLHNLSLHKLEGMEKLVRLRVADLSGNELHDTAPLKSCACLEELNLEGNELTTSGLRGLMGLRRLAKLDLGYNQISDLHPLCGLTGLSQLSLESNLLHK